MQRKCTCDHFSPPERVVRAPEFISELGQYYCDQPGSGDAVINDVLTETYDCRTGRLFGPSGAEIPVDTLEGAGLFDRVFGRDPRRLINRLREKATRPSMNLLDRRCVLPTAILHLARQIKLCRTQGPCSLL